MRKIITILLFGCVYLSGAAQLADTTQKLPNADYFTPRGGLFHTSRAIVSGKQVTVAFVGGSITFNPGWRQKICDYLSSTYPATSFYFIAAGIPSLGSLPHAFRLQRDVLDSGKIDLLFLEAAVNDRVNGTDSITQLRALEGIIRHAKKRNRKTDIIMMSFADPAKTNDYNHHIIPVEITNQELLATHYHLPSINLAREVSERLAHREFSWEKDFIDLHPSPFGQQLYFQTIKALLDTCLKQPADGMKNKHNASRMPAPLDEYNFQHGKYVSVSKATYASGWHVDTNWVPADHLPVRPGFVHKPVLIATTPGATLTFSFKGNAVGIATVSGADAGMITYSIDDGPLMKKSLYTQWSSSLYLPWYILLGSGLPGAHHQLHLSIDPVKDTASKGSACRIIYFLVNGK